MLQHNRHQIIGYLGGDPELSATKKGKQVATFSVATTERWKDSDSGDPKEHTEWHQVTVWGDRALILRDHLKKGSPVFVEGPVHTNQWKDRDGRDREKKTIIADKILFLPPNGRNTNAEPSPQ